MSNMNKENLKLEIEQTLAYIKNCSSSYFCDDFYLVTIADKSIMIDHICANVIEEDYYYTKFGKQIKTLLNVSEIKVLDVEVAYQVQNVLINFICYVNTHFVVIGDICVPIETFKDYTYLETIYSPELAKLISEVNTLSFQMHTPSLKDEDICKIWADGHTSVKGPGFLNFKVDFKEEDKIFKGLNHIVFPLYENERRHAIVTKENANTLREKMKDIARSIGQD